MKIWIINPYGTLRSESWATYRSTMLAENMSKYGYDVTQFISNFEHRSKTFRSEGYQKLTVNNLYTISIIPSTPYSSHISYQRIKYERTFAKNLLKIISPADHPDFIVLAEPALFYYDILLKPLVLKGTSKLILDIIDIWPELFEIALPKAIVSFSRILLTPFLWWRKRLYKHAHGIVAVSLDYLRIAKTITNRNIPFEVVYWSYHPDQLSVKPTHHRRIKALIASKKADEIWVVYAGTLGENYDIHSIVSAAKSLRQELKIEVNYKFVIAGDGPLKPLCEKNQSENFIFLGRLDPEDLKFLYQYCDIALSTYKGESTVAMPIKAFDYLLFGLPIVNSLGRDLGELINRYQLGINYDPYSPASLYKAIYTLIVDTEFRKGCSSRARVLAKEFHGDIQYKKFVDLIEKLK